MAGTRFISKRLQEEPSDDAGVCPKLRRKLASSMIKILGGQHLTTMHIGHGQCISFLCHCGPSVKHVALTGCLRLVKLVKQTRASKGASNKLALDSLTCVLHPFGRSRLSLSSGCVSGNGYLVISHSPIRLESLKELVLESGAFSEIRTVLRFATGLEKLEFDWPSGGSALQHPNCSPISFSRLPNLRDLCMQAFGPSLRRSDPFIGLYDDLRLWSRAILSLSLSYSEISFHSKGLPSTSLSLLAMFSLSSTTRTFRPTEATGRRPLGQDYVSQPATARGRTIREQREPVGGWFFFKRLRSG
ncbi:hypothetical protein BKA70DRAFT_694219 [Coprinopsis sp. MPI-PUGE-AT-0042]|nr:hypothetical protein BKA70DRAFT_694219 [Coprinopsis sp. MPI-PUGE-AT-0042]